MPSDAVERLIDSTQELLWERGYVGTSPKALQRLAGVGQGSMYHHFAGKADLAIAAVTRSAGQLEEAVETMLSAPGGPLDLLCAYLSGDRDVLRGCRIGRLAYDPEVITDPELREPVERTFAWLVARLAQLVTEAQQAGELPDQLDPHSLAATVVAVVQGGYVLARAAGSVEPFQQAAGGAIALLRAVRDARPQ